MGFLTLFLNMRFNGGRHLCRPFLLCLLILSAGCALPGPHQRTAAAYRIAADQGWHAEKISAGRFNFQVFMPRHKSTDLVVYVEGDGLAWLDSATPSSDPTPSNPLGLRLALRHPGNNAAYLGRPCQYDPENIVRICRKTDWTDGRYSKEIVDAANLALNELKQRMGARQINLVGYSGGGTLAALMAARRGDVRLLVTIAAVLDHTEWTAQLGLSPLAASLNPIDDWELLRTLPQVHFVGQADKVTGWMAVQRYINLGQDAPITVRTLESFDHACCWVAAWPQLWQELHAGSTFIK